MHKVRIVNPSSDSGSTQGTEVWLDDFKLDGVTQVSFYARVNDLYQFDVSLNVSLMEIVGRGHLRAEVQLLIYRWWKRFKALWLTDGRTP